MEDMSFIQFGRDRFDTRAVASKDREKDLELFPERDLGLPELYSYLQ